MDKGYAQFGRGPRHGGRRLGIGHDAVELALGSARAGCVFVPVIWRLAAPEMLDAARSVGLKAAELVVKTTIPQPAAAPVRQAKPLSAATQKALQAALDSLRDPDESKGRGDAN